MSEDLHGGSLIPGSTVELRKPILLSAVLTVALALRLYLSFDNYCISGDGVAYLRMAQGFAEGDWRKPLESVFSPLYPVLIATLHPLIANWEVAGNLVSALLGTAAVVAIYLMIRAAFGREDFALGAAALAAIHPELAAYSASVRTEAGYIFLMSAAVWLILRTLRDGRIGNALIAGVVAGCAYLYRTEAIGLFVLAALFIPLASIVWKRLSLPRGIAASAAFTLAFLTLAAPYVLALRLATGHWAVSREFTAAMMYGIGDVAHNSAHWRHLGFSADASPLTPILAAPRLYLEKVCADLVTSLYNFVQALDPFVTALLAVGLWMRGRKLFSSAGESFLALLTVFYFCGFALSYTGTRFMVHLIQYTFGWVMIGLWTVSEALERVSTPRGWSLPQGTAAAVLALVLLPRTVWPIGYDMRGVRYAGEDIAKLQKRPETVIARDGRIAWYADARFVALPGRPQSDFCSWLAMQNAGYVVADEHDESRLHLADAGRCLAFIKRYPRSGKGHFDLYAVRRPESAAR